MQIAFVQYTSYLPTMDNATFAKKSQESGECLAQDKKQWRVRPQRGCQLKARIQKYTTDKRRFSRSSNQGSVQTRPASRGPSGARRNALAGRRQGSTRASTHRENAPRPPLGQCSDTEGSVKGPGVLIVSPAARFAGSFCARATLKATERRGEGQGKMVTTRPTSPVVSITCGRRR
jgi:hypothetical protein